MKGEGGGEKEVERGGEMWGGVRKRRGKDGRGVG